MANLFDPSYSFSLICFFVVLLEDQYNCCEIVISESVVTYFKNDTSIVYTREL